MRDAKKSCLTTLDHVARQHVDQIGAAHKHTGVVEDALRVALAQFAEGSVEYRKLSALLLEQEAASESIAVLQQEAVDRAHRVAALAEQFDCFGEPSETLSVTRTSRRTPVRM